MTDTATTLKSIDASTFTLASALAWAGHVCDGGCPSSATQTPASLWFVRRSPAGRPSWMATLVVIDLGSSYAPVAEVQALLREVKRCARRDHIQVRERLAVDQGHALAALGQWPSTTRAALYLHPHLRPLDPAGSSAVPEQRGA